MSKVFRGNFDTHGPCITLLNVGPCFTLITDSLKKILLQIIRTFCLVHTFLFCN